MTILQDILAIQRGSNNNGVEPTVLRLSPRALVQVRSECANMMLWPSQIGAIETLFGMQIVREQPKLYCEGCGALMQPVRCDYCRRPTPYIECI